MQPLNKNAARKPQARNDAVHLLMSRATGIEPAWTSDMRANPFGWLVLEHPDQLKDVAEALSGSARLCTITAYAEERDDADKRRRIAYHFAIGDTVLTVSVPIYDKESMKKLPVPSITPWFRNADWNEREFREMFNIEIIDHPNPNRLFLDERLDAGIMAKLIPFSAMASGAASNTLWERVLEAKGVPPEERLPSLARPAEPITAEPKVTPVAQSRPVKAPAAPTLTQMAAPADEAVAAHAEALAREAELAEDADRVQDEENPEQSAQSVPAPEQAGQASEQASEQAPEQAPETPAGAPAEASKSAPEPERAPAKAGSERDGGGKSGGAERAKPGANKHPGKKR